MKITKEEFIKYERVRISRVTNMFNVTIVCKISKLEREKVLFIMEKYSELKKKFAFTTGEGK